MKIYISKFDFERLTRLLAKNSPHRDYEKALAAELEKAEILEASDIPSDVITMNSQIKLTDEKGNTREYSLVFPEDADLTQNKLSILSPIGCALIGYRVGDKIMTPTPKGQRELTVTEITYQPERAGDVNL